MMQKIINRARGFFSKVQEGFTLIELLVVIAIIALLASIILVSLNSARQKANDTRVISDVTQARDQIETDILNGVYPDLTGAVNVSNSTLGAAAGAGLKNLTTVDTDAKNYGPSGNANLTYLIATNANGVATAFGIYGQTNSGWYCADYTGNNLTVIGSTPGIPGAGAASTTCH